MNKIDVDNSQDDVIDDGRKMNRNVDFLIPFRIAVFRHGVCFLIDLAELDSNVRIDCLSISWSYIFALVDLHCELIAFSFDMGRH